MLDEMYLVPPAEFFKIQHIFAMEILSIFVFHFMLTR